MKFNTLIASLFVIVQLSFGEVGLNEKLGHKIADDISVISEDSVVVNLTSYIDKPTILSLVYYNCPGICTPVMNGIAELIDKSDLELGTDYQVLTVSFNDAERPSLAKKKKNNYLNTMENKKAATHWRFFTADSENIQKIVRETGFGFNKIDQDFAHPAALIIVNKDKVITRYMYGARQLPLDFKMTIKNANEGIAEPSMAKSMKYCYSYDSPGRLMANKLKFAFGGGMAVILIGFFIWLVAKPVKKA